VGHLFKGLWVSEHGNTAIQSLDALSWPKRRFGTWQRRPNGDWLYLRTGFSRPRVATTEQRIDYIRRHNEWKDGWGFALHMLIVFACYAAFTYHQFGPHRFGAAIFAALGIQGIVTSSLMSGIRRDWPIVGTPVGLFRWLAIRYDAFELARMSATRLRVRLALQPIFLAVLIWAVSVTPISSTTPAFWLYLAIVLFIGPLAETLVALRARLILRGFRAGVLADDNW
jgi:hypothetical protein